MLRVSANFWLARSLLWRASSGFLELSFQPTDGYLKTLDGLLGLLSLIRSVYFCLLDCQLQLGYLLCQAISFRLEIG